MKPMLAGGVSFWFDRTKDPAKNFAEEEDLYRLMERGQLPQLVRLWVDSECLVRGRAKSPRYGWYREDVARSMGIPVLERSTGGGVVYHDRGNLNWSFHLRNSGEIRAPRRLFEEASSFLVGALERLGVGAEFSPPNRIDVSGRKVSGMAARSSPRAVLVHGTLLLDSDLGKLNRLCLAPPGCPPVANLREWVPGIRAAGVVDALAAELEASGHRVSAFDGTKRGRPPRR